MRVTSVGCRVVMFRMPGYSRMQPEADRRRTLYRNPSVKVGNDGKTVTGIYNNYPCKRLSVSAEGITPDGQGVDYRP